MSYEEGPANGDFCWTEIATSDAQKCREFYANVFGWRFQDSDAVTDGFAYHEYYTGGCEYPAGGLYEINAAMCGDGPLPPPHILPYIAVNDVDENARRAAELGATILKEPTDIPNTGRFAVIQDPTGAVFATFKMQS